MLEGVQSQVGEFGRFCAAKNAKYPALVVEVVVRQLLGMVHSLLLAAFRAVATCGALLYSFFKPPAPGVAQGLPHAVQTRSPAIFDAKVAAHDFPDTLNRNTTFCSSFGNVSK